MSTRTSPGRQSDRDADAIARVRWYYSVGREVLARSPGDRAPVGLILHIAEERGIGQDDVRKARAFARLFAERDVERLITGAYPIRWSHIRLLVSIADRSERMDWARRIQHERLSKQRFQDALAQSRPRRAPPGAGRPRTILELSRGEQEMRLIRASREFLVAAEQPADALDEADLRKLLRLVIRAARDRGQRRR
jgi:hypothetical protein